MLVITAKGLLSLSAAWRNLLARISTKLSAVQANSAKTTRANSAAELAEVQAGAYALHNKRVNAAYDHLARSVKHSLTRRDESLELAAMRHDLNCQKAQQYVQNSEALASTADSLNERSQNLRSVSKLL